MVVLAADSGAIPYWKTVVIRAIGPMLSALMIYGVGYQGVTHASQHNADGSHKTVQVQGSTRREDCLLAEGHWANGDRGDKP